MALSGESSPHLHRSTLLTGLGFEIQKINSVLSKQRAELTLGLLTAKTDQWFRSHTEKHQEGSDVLPILYACLGQRGMLALLLVSQGTWQEAATGPRG